VTAPEGRAREREWSGRPHRLRETRPRSCEPRTAGGTTRGLRPRPSSVRRPHPSGCRKAGPPGQRTPATGQRGRVTRAASSQGDLAAAHLVSQRTARLDRASARPGCTLQPRSVATRCSPSRHSSNGGPPGSPARWPRCFGTGAASRSQVPHRSSDRPRTRETPSSRDQHAARCARTSGRGGVRTEPLPATRRTPWSAAGCNRPALRVWSKPSKP